MIRGYAIGLGAGTQVLTHLPYFAFEGLQGELGRSLAMGAGWFINLAFAEWIIQRRAAQPGRPTATPWTVRSRRVASPSTGRPSPSRPRAPA